MKKYYFGFFSIFCLLTSSVQAYENYLVDYKKNLLEQYITAREHDIAICPTWDQFKIKNGLQRDFNNYLHQAEQGSVAAAYWVGLAYLQGVGVQSDDNKGIMWLKKAVAAGYEPAKTKYFTVVLADGKSYPNLTTDQKGTQKMFSWLNQAAKKGDSTAL
ncbi:MAG: sel1 repeat family protein, partial [Proteobacteria bacterium]|nr:sel1 repeat family protein [Pseudomonadota bacterium]